jgi:cytochrome c nitrite reductase small subunit
MKNLVDKFMFAGIIIGVSLGLAAGLGAYTFIYAKGGSYLINDPAVCANCHVMNEHYSGWIRSSHRAVAVCNDCHIKRSSE